MGGLTLGRQAAWGNESGRKQGRKGHGVFTGKQASHRTQQNTMHPCTRWVDVVGTGIPYVPQLPSNTEYLVLTMVLVMPHRSHVVA